MLSLDPFALDRSIARFAEQREKFLVALAADGGEEHVFEDLPRGFDPELVRTLDDAASRDPLAAPLARWLRFLLLEHTSIDHLRRLTRAMRAPLRIDEPERAELSVHEMRKRIVREPERGAEWQRTLSTRGTDAIVRRLEYFEYRNEGATRLGILAPEWVGEIGDLSGGLVAATDDAFAELRPRSLGDLARLGLGREAPGDYPNRITPRGLGELLDEGAWLSGLEPRLGELPEALGPASLARGLEALGRGLHDAGASRSQPFVVAHDPMGLRRAEFGSLLALLLMNPAFAARKLGVDRNRQSDYLRVMSRVGLVALRVSLARTALSLASRAEPRAYRQAFEIVVPRATGCELPIGLVGLVFVEEYAPQHFAGFLAAAARAHDLVQKKDEDWFRDPRVVEDLRAELETPPSLEPDLDRLVYGADVFLKALSRHW